MAKLIVYGVIKLARTTGRVYVYCPRCTAPYDAFWAYRIVRMRGNQVRCAECKTLFIIPDLSRLS